MRDKVDEAFEEALEQSINQAMGIQLEMARPDMFYIAMDDYSYVTYTRIGAMVHFLRMPPFCRDC